MTYRRLRGYYRLLWGWCPRCNSDAPAVDNCPVCVGHDKWDWWARFADRGYC